MKLTRRSGSALPPDAFVNRWSRITPWNHREKKNNKCSGLTFLIKTSESPTITMRTLQHNTQHNIIRQNTITSSILFGNNDYIVNIVTNTKQTGFNELKRSDVVMFLTRHSSELYLPTDNVSDDLLIQAPRVNSKQEAINCVFDVLLEKSIPTKDDKINVFFIATTPSPYLYCVPKKKSSVTPQAVLIFGNFFTSTCALKNIVNIILDSMVLFVR